MKNFNYQTSTLYEYLSTPDTKVEKYNENIKKGAQKYLSRKNKAQEEARILEILLS